jgi:hypothetical protein
MRGCTIFLKVNTLHPQQRKSVQPLLHGDGHYRYCYLDMLQQFLIPVRPSTHSLPEINFAALIVENIHPLNKFI